MKFTTWLWCVILGGNGSLCLAENWPGWRGPRGDGSSSESLAPVYWGSSSNIIWSVALPGEGHSSPIVWGENLFLTTAFKESRERVLLCFSRADGRERWRQTVLQADLEAKNAENSYASATPATDGTNIYVTFLDGKDVAVAAYDFEGRSRWLVRPGQFYSQWGFSHNPILFGDRVIVDCDSKGENFIVALNRADGRTAWKVQRENGTQSYSAPLVDRMAGNDQLIIAGNKAVTSYDPVNGRLRWMVDGPSDDSVVTPVYSRKCGLVLSCSSWPKKVLIAIRPDGSGNVTQSRVVWTATEGTPYVPSPISVGDWFFTASFANKEAYCFEAETGKILWHEKMGLHHASPVCANGVLYFLNDEGVMHVVKAGPRYELLASNELGEKTYASPALSEGQMFLRGFKHLFCIGRRAAH